MPGHTRVDGGSCKINFSIREFKIAKSRRRKKRVAAPRASVRGMIRDDKGGWLRVAYDDGIGIQQGKTFIEGPELLVVLGHHVTKDSEVVRSVHWDSVVHQGCFQVLRHALLAVKAHNLW